ncbi:hypothetical protein T484DRAFT_3650014, partial [Baffinella frigidus]
INPTLLIEDGDGSGPNQARIVFKTSSTNWCIGQHGGSDGRFKIANDDVFGDSKFSLLKTTGYCGINNDTPLYQLDVSGNINTNGTYKINGSDITTDNIPQTATNLYYNYPSTAGQLNTLLKHSGDDMATFLRFRRGGPSPGTTGLCLSSYDDNNFFIYAYGDDLTIRYSDAFTATLDTGYQPSGTDIIKLNTTSLNVNLPINTTGTISIDNNDTADFELLKFDTARPWSFWNRGTAGSSSLELKSSVSGKSFRISDSLGNTFAKFQATTNSFVALSRLSVGSSLNTPNHTIDAEGDINISGSYKINGVALSYSDLTDTPQTYLYNFESPLLEDSAIDLVTGKKSINLLYNTSHFELNA